MYIQDVEDSSNHTEIKEENNNGKLAPSTSEEPNLETELSISSSQPRHSETSVTLNNEIEPKENGNGENGENKHLDEQFV